MQLVFAALESDTVSKCSRAAPPFPSWDSALNIMGQCSQCHGTVLPMLNFYYTGPPVNST